MTNITSLQDILNLLKKLVLNDFLVSESVRRGIIYQTKGHKETAEGLNTLAGGLSKITGSLNTFMKFQTTLNKHIQRLKSKYD